jgi:hypothetical protein
LDQASLDHGFGSHLRVLLEDVAEVARLSAGVGLREVLLVEVLQVGLEALEA